MSRKRRRLAPSRTKQGVLSSFAGIDSKAVKVTDQIFAGTTARASWLSILPTVLAGTRAR